MSVFKKGYEVAKEAAEKQEENRGKKLYNFFIPAATRDHPDAEAEVQFLHEEPINYMAHTVKTIRKGKEAYDSVVCYPEGNCPLCFDNQAKPMAAYLIFDKRPYERKDQSGKTLVVEGQIRLYLVGMKIVTQLARLSERYGLTKFLYNIVRNGSGTTTTYSFERGEKVVKNPITILKETLPDSLKEGFKDIDSLLSDQLMMRVASGVVIPKNEEEDEEEEVVDKSAHKNLISVDDEDEDIDEVPTTRTVKAIFKKKGDK